MASVADITRCVFLALGGGASRAQGLKGSRAQVAAGTSAIGPAWQIGWRWPMAMGLAVRSSIA
jgi:hypothetical protein